MEDLLKKGGTIRQKYELLLLQQWERRQTLVQLGECSGMFKIMVKCVCPDSGEGSVGCPAGRVVGTLVG